MPGLLMMQCPNRAEDFVVVALGYWGRDSSFTSFRTSTSFRITNWGEDDERIELHDRMDDGRGPADGDGRAGVG